MLEFEIVKDLYIMFAMSITILTQVAIFSQFIKD